MLDKHSLASAPVRIFAPCRGCFEIASQSAPICGGRGSPHACRALSRLKAAGGCSGCWPPALAASSRFPGHHLQRPPAPGLGLANLTAASNASRRRARKSPSRRRHGGFHDQAPPSPALDTPGPARAAGTRHCGPGPADRSGHGHHVGPARTPGPATDFVVLESKSALCVSA